MKRPCGRIVPYASANYSKASAISNARGGGRKSLEVSRPKFPETRAAVGEMLNQPTGEPVKTRFDVGLVESPRCGNSGPI